MEANVIPTAAWIQAVFVCLFIVFATILFRLLAKQQEWYDKQQDKWQAFIKSRDVSWQEWMNLAETRTAAQMKNVTIALENLAEKLESHDDKVISKLDDHEKRTDERLDKMKDAKRKNEG